MSVDQDPAAPLRNLSALEGAEERAFRRGEQSAALKGTVEAHERRLNALNGSIDKQTGAIRDLEKTVDKLATVAETRAVDAVKAAEQGLSTRTFIIALFTAATGVCAVVIAAVALFLH